MKKFIVAVENRDVDTTHSLIIPDEIEKLNLTKNGIKVVLEETLWKYGKIKAAVLRRASKVGSTRDQEVWNHTWKSLDTGKEITGTNKLGKMVTRLAVAPTKSGWRVNFTPFIMGFCATTNPPKQSFKARYAAICRKAGIKGYWQYGVEPEILNP